MASKRYFLIVVSWILLIVASTFILGLVWAKSRNMAILVGGAVLICMEVIGSVYRLNRINRQIAYLFQSLENQDTSIRFSTQGKGTVFKELIDSLNHSVLVFQDLMLENAVKEQLFLAMIEHSSTGFISVDKHGDFEVMNRAARNLLGSLHTSNVSHLKEAFPGLYHQIQILPPGTLGSCKIELKDGPRLVQVSSAPLRFQDQEFNLISLQDIQNEIDVKEMESWQKLIRVINHEIMNSIAPIVSASKSLRPVFVQEGSPVKPEEIDEKMILDTISGLEIIDNMSRGLKNFVSNYRRLSQVPEPETGALNLKQWAGTLKVLFQELTSNDEAELDVRISKEIDTIHVDEGLFNQVMVNLLKNAWEAPESTLEKHIRVTVNPYAQRKVCICVINNGLPIPKEIQDQIFVPFFTSKDGGSGVGLFVSRLIINAHKGSITSSTNADSETVFEIVL